jgi:hypothetical protein
LVSGLEVNGQFGRTPEGTRIRIGPGRVLHHSRVSPAVCDGALKFVLPVLSEVTWVEGDLSLELKESMIDLDQPERSALEGQILIHDVRAGLKSPLVRELSVAVVKLLGGNGAETITLAHESTVEFWLREGRVTHKGLAFGLPEISPELQVRSSGSVGLDETLDLIVEIPLPLRLLGDGPLASALGNQTLRLPVGGTLEKPEVRFEGDELISGLLATFGERLSDGETPLLDFLEQVRQVREQRRELQQREGWEDGEGLLPRLRARPGLLDRLRRRSQPPGGQGSGERGQEPQRNSELGQS